MPLMRRTRLDDEDHEGVDEDNEGDDGEGHHDSGEGDHEALRVMNLVSEINGKNNGG